MINKDLKIVVTGVKGQLGYDCVLRLSKLGYKNIIGIDKDELDITDEKAVDSFFLENKPNVLIHNAAYTAVDKAEIEPDIAYKVNALGPKYLASACNKVGAKMIYVSTDYVFKGDGDNFYEVNDKKEGLSVYGKSKSQGEDYVISNLKEHFIVRTSWVFGINGKNFVKTMINLGKTRDSLNIVCDQIGSPTYTHDLAVLLCDMINSDKYGIYHAHNEGVCSWADFASYIFKAANLNVKVNYLTTEEYLKLVPNQAKRPLNSRLSTKSLTDNGFNLLPTWQDAIDRYIDELKSKGELL